MLRQAELRYFWCFGALLLTSVALAALLDNPLLILLPFAALALFWACHRLHRVFYLLIASIPWSVEYHVTNTLATDLPDEPLMVVTSFSVLAFVLYYRKQKPLAHLLTPIGLLLLLQVVWYVVTVAFSTQPLLSAKFLLAKTWYLGAFVAAPFLLFQEARHLKNSALLLTGSMMAFTAVALVRHLKYDFTFEKINDSLQPFFHNHVNYSALLVCTIPLLFLFYRSCGQKRLKRVLFLLLLTALVALFLSYARGAWLALVAGGAAYLLLRRQWLLKGYVLGLALLIAGLSWLIQDNRYLKFAHDYRTTVFHTDFRDHLVATYQLKDVSTAERFYRWIAGVRMVKDGWQTGFGPNTFYSNYRGYGVTAFRTWVSNNEEHSTVHNYFLLTLIEQGVIGLLLLLLLLGYMFYKAQQLYATSASPFWKGAAGGVAVILSMLCTVNFLSDLVETDELGSLFYLCAGTLLAMVARDRKASELSPDV